MLLMAALGGCQPDRGMGRPVRGRLEAHTQAAPGGDGARCSPCSAHSVTSYRSVSPVGRTRGSQNEGAGVGVATLTVAPSDRSGDSMLPGPAVQGSVRADPRGRSKSFPELQATAHATLWLLAPKDQPVRRSITTSQPSVLPSLPRAIPSPLPAHQCLSDPHGAQRRAPEQGQPTPLLL